MQTRLVFKAHGMLLRIKRLETKETGVKESEVKPYALRRQKIGF